MTDFQHSLHTETREQDAGFSASQAPKPRPKKPRTRRSLRQTSKRARRSADATPPDPTKSPVFQAIQTWRKKDNRTWKDIEVEEFPSTFFYNLHQEEWKQKKEYAARLIHQIQYHPSASPAILDAGCGCGWLTNYLADHSNATVTGIDLDPTQIEQARKLFSHDRLSFLQESLFSRHLPLESFDMIIIMHALPWMRDLNQVVDTAKALLKPGGQIHIIGTPFYSPRKIQKIRQEWETYCLDKQMESIIPHYQLFSKEDLSHVNASIISSDSMLKSLFRSTKSVADWVMIRK